ncbi:MAG: phosphate signaling complex protein PhoU [Endomicrobiia bacterium]
MLNERIKDLKKHLIDYSNLVEKMLQTTTKGLLDKNKDLLNDVINIKEPIANQYEIEFDEICTNTIAQYQPVSKNLRTLISIIKMSNDLERMADHCVNIAEYSLSLIKEPDIKQLIDLPKMAMFTNSMLKDSIQAFVNEDICLAKDVCLRDDQIDKLNKIIKEDLYVLMKENSDVIKNALKLIAISSNLERIADLTTNICEEVIYFAEGFVIKHHSNQDKIENKKCVE